MAMMVGRLQLPPNRQPLESQNADEDIQSDVRAPHSEVGWAR